MGDLVLKARDVRTLFDLAGAGADVAIAGKTNANNFRVADSIVKLGRKSLAVEVEVRDEAQVVSMVERVVKRFGRLDILVNSAGYAEVRPIAEFPLDLWEYIMDVNVKGTFLCSREAAKVMLKQGSGKIVNISSLQGFAGRAGDAAYAASKSAVNLMTMSMACDVTPFYEKLQTRIPARRAGNREDIFGIVVFLASRASDFINGAIIPVDGGAIASDGFPVVPAVE